MFSFIRLSRAMVSLHCNKTLSNMREKKAENIVLGKKSSHFRGWGALSSKFSNILNFKDDILR